MRKGCETEISIFICLKFERKFYDCLSPSFLENSLQDSEFLKKVEMTYILENEVHRLFLEPGSQLSPNPPSPQICVTYSSSTSPEIFT